jgi:hypothetical protein
MQDEVLLLKRKRERKLQAPGIGCLKGFCKSYYESRKLKLKKPKGKGAQEQTWSCY